MTKSDIAAFSSYTPTIAQPEMRLRSLTTGACGKAIIVGEHAVVYGAQAVAMPVPSMQMTVNFTPTMATDKYGAPLVRVLLGGRTVSEHLLGVVHDAFAVLGIEPFGCDVEGHSSILIGAGLGSSASLCIVVLKALADATGQTLSAQELAAAGNRLEKRFHGNPSGLDTAVVACEQVIAFVKGQKPNPIPVSRLQQPNGTPKPWHFALLDTGARSSTLAMIQIAAPYFTGPGGGQRLAQFDQMAVATQQGLARGDADVVAEAMNAASAHLAEAGVVSARISEVMATARAAGVLAAKPTGAGGGGCVLALLDPTKLEDQLANLCSRLGSNRVFATELA